MPCMCFLILAMWSNRFAFSFYTRFFLPLRISWCDIDIIYDKKKKRRNCEYLKIDERTFSISTSLVSILTPYPCLDVFSNCLLKKTKTPSIIEMPVFENRQSNPIEIATWCFYLSIERHAISHMLLCSLMTSFADSLEHIITCTATPLSNRQNLSMSLTKIDKCIFIDDAIYKFLSLFISDEKRLLTSLPIRWWKIPYIHFHLYAFFGNWLQMMLRKVFYSSEETFLIWVWKVLKG